MEAATVCGALGKTRTSNLLIRSQMLYPLSYERWRVTMLPLSVAALPPYGRQELVHHGRHELPLRRYSS